jgi:prepilin-type processing-associated H-X9-DG protein
MKEKQANAGAQATRRERNVMIIGGGMAGPALALFLRKAGIRSSVYEAYPEPADIGGGFQIAPNGMNVLAALGLADAVAAQGCRVREMCFRDDRGALLARFANGSPTRQGQPAIAFARTVLHRLLLEELTRAGVAVHYGKRLESIDVHSDRATVTFADGSCAVGDLVVGADGVRSQVRAAAFPTAPAPSYLGSLGFGGFVDPAAVPASLLSDLARHEMTFMMGSRDQIGYCCFSETEPRWGWFVHMPQPEELSREQLAALDVEQVRRDLLSRFAGWAAPAESFIRHTPTILKTSFYEMPPLLTWHTDRVVLIGDAAHAMSTSGGQGASIALEDAMCLAKLLRDRGSDLAGALATFEQMRRSRAEKTAAQSRTNEERKMTALGRTGTWLRNRMLSCMLPLVGERGLRWMYDYRIAWEP